MGIRRAVRGATWAVIIAGVLAGCGPDRTAPIDPGRLTADTTTPPGARALAGVVRPLTGDPRDYDALMAMIGDASVVLLGEESHGTHEFYAERARITQRLVTEKGFNAVAIEGD